MAGFNMDGRRDQQIFRWTSCQWEFQDPKMVRDGTMFQAIFRGDIPVLSPYKLAWIFCARYLQFSSVPEMSSVQNQSVYHSIESWFVFFGIFQLDY